METIINNSLLPSHTIILLECFRKAYVNKIKLNRNQQNPYEMLHLKMFMK